MCKEWLSECSFGIWAFLRRTVDVEVSSRNVPKRSGHLDPYLDLARLALKTAIPGIVMLAIAPLAYRILMRLHASHVVRSEDRSETWRLFPGFAFRTKTLEVSASSAAKISDPSDISPSYST